MTLTAFALVFVSVFLHAGWNLVSKKSNPSGAFYLLSSLTASLIWLGFFLCSGVSLSALDWSFWGLLLSSIICETVYCLALAYGYRAGEISLVYPLGRALPVLMVALVTTLLGLGKTPGIWAVAGMTVISVGCILLPLKKFREFHWKTYCSRVLLFVILIAAGTTGYTVIDSVAGKMLQAAPGGSRITKALTYLFFIEFGLTISLAIYVSRVKWERQEFKRLFLKSPWPCITGLCSSSAYALILLAMGFVSNVSYIQAFRQMSLPLGALAGIVLLKESCSLPKLIGIGLVVTGLVIVVF